MTVQELQAMLGHLIEDGLGEKRIVIETYRGTDGEGKERYSFMDLKFGGSKDSDIDEPDEVALVAVPFDSTSKIL